MTSRSDNAALANLARVVGEIRAAAPEGCAVVEASGELLRALCDDVESLLLELDSQRSIDFGAKVSHLAYWSCQGIPCSACPARIGAATPAKLYSVHSCSIAQTLDLLRRQRALDAREGGAE